MIEEKAKTLANNDKRKRSILKMIAQDKSHIQTKLLSAGHTIIGGFDRSITEQHQSNKTRNLQT